jgi:excisionase family DNA binding protein
MYTKRPIPLPKVSEAGDALLTPGAFAKASGVSLSTIWRRLRANELPSVKRGGRRLIPADALVKPAQARPVDEKHPMWKFVGAAKSGGAGPGSSDKYRYLSEEALGRRR